MGAGKVVLKGDGLEDFALSDLLRDLLEHPVIVQRWLGLGDIAVVYEGRTLFTGSYYKSRGGQDG